MNRALTTVGLAAAMLLTACGDTKETSTATDAAETVGPAPDESTPSPAVAAPPATADMTVPPATTPPIVSEEPTTGAVTDPVPPR